MSKLKTLNSNSSTKSKRVHFDSKDHVLVYDDTRDQSNELFYSEKEYDAMRNANKGVIEDVANQLFLSPISLGKITNQKGQITKGITKYWPT